MLAASRTDSVMGRIIRLTDSIITINCERGSGVPKGTKWAKKFLVFFILLNKRNLNHKGKAIESVSLRWHVKVKTYGNKPNAFLIRINQKIVDNIIILPRVLVLLKEACISFSRNIIISLFPCKVRFLLIKIFLVHISVNGSSKHR
jgi:hypothetical protein